ncbi:HAMP domain-containing sensor histidine kinase [Hymenobacter sp. BT559]|uniref:sensor histidine kinase n=1 Tax=Hymenobacter sp. BT559 TaxID=2795729 RepID=UPI0018EBF1D3|nr:ATP-binding protein [Hymenobacter sp. BT559]MBJ6142689.1 HAMP domain-containing protein [Hymenobacter sp. BT559]
MTIRNRLTWLFVSVVAVLLLGVLTVVFLLQSSASQREFRQRLRDRAQVTSYIYLEKDEMRASAFRDFEKKYLQSLSNEILQVYDAQGRVRFVAADERVRLSDALLARIVLSKEAYFKLGERQAVGIFYHDNQGDYVIVAAAENVYGHRRMRSLATIMAGIFILSLLLIYAVGRIFAGRALAPIAALNDQVDRITAQDLHLRVAEPLRTSEKDDLRRLARTFNRLLGRLETSFEGQRTFVRNASHELRTPLTSSIGELQVMLARERSAEAYKEGATSVLGELQQLKQLINNLLDLAQADEAVPLTEDIRLDELLWEVREAVAPAQRSRVQVDLGDLSELPDDPAVFEIKGHRVLLARALGNLVDNALKYSSAEQRVTLSLRHLVGGGLIVRVADAGQGIAEEDLAQVFQPFFRAADVRGVVGHGVGLPLAQRIVALYGGTLVLHSDLGRGTVAEVAFAQ